MLADDWVADVESVSLVDDDEAITGCAKRILVTFFDVWEEGPELLTGGIVA